MVFTVSDSEREELMTSLACLILHDDSAPVSEENINTLITAAGGEVAAYWPKLFADLLQERDMGDLILKAGSIGGGSAPAAGAAAAGGAAAVEETVEEADEESEEDVGGGGLFGDGSDSDDSDSD